MEYMFTPHTPSLWIFPFFIFPLSCLSAWTFLPFSSLPFHLNSGFSCFSLLFPTPQNLFSHVWFSAPCLFCCLVQSRSDRKSQTPFCHAKSKHSPLHFPHLTWGMAGRCKHTHARCACNSLFSISDCWEGKRRMEEGGPHLFDAVWVDGGLWLQDADWLCLLGALGHLPHLLSDEVVDTVQRFHRPLD